MTRLDKSTDLKRIYEQLTRSTRWLVIIFVASSLWLQPYSHGQIVVLLVIAVIYNSLHYIPGFGEQGPLSNKWLAIVTNFALMALLVVLTGELQSPYVPLLFLTVMSGAYWYGYYGWFFSLGLTGGLITVMALQNGQWNVSELGLLAALFLLGHYLAKLSILDETDREKIIRTDENLQREEARLLTLLNSVGEAIVAVDNRDMVMLYNSAALELIDTHYDILNQPFMEAVRLVDAKGEAVLIAQEVLKTGRSVIREDLILKAQTYSPAVSVHATPIMESGQLTGVMVLLHDISRQKTFENQKDEFVSIISHELRTPVAIVEANVSTALLPTYTKLPEKARKVLTDAQKNITFLSGLLRDLSDLARSERAVLENEITQFSPSDVAREVYQNFTQQAAQAGHTLEVKINLPVDMSITSSRQRVQEILVNYVTNAIKYSGRDTTITIGVEQAKKIAGGIRFWVRDEGVGVSRAEQAMLFNKFYRVQNKQTAGIKGSGMGLYIVKKQADSLSAKVWVESSVGKGSTFFVELPHTLPKAK